MKKIPIMTLILCMLVSLFASCTGVNNTDTGDNTDSSSINPSPNTNTSVSNNTSTDENVENNQNGVQAFPNLTLVNKEHSYYTTIESNGIEYIGNDFPNELGTYIKLFDTASEFAASVDCDGIDEATFEYNYVLALKIHTMFTPYSYRMVGCYDICLKGDEYSINLDYYSQIEGDNERVPTYAEAVEEIDVIKYFLIPKGEIESFDGVKNITLNKSQIEGCHYTSSFVKHYTSPNEQSAMIYQITSENRAEIVEALGLYDYFYNGTLLIYLPIEMQGDILLSGVEITDNRISVTFENYTHVENKYVERNDARYYMIENFAAFEKIPEEYEVNITVNMVYVPSVTVCDIFYRD